MADDASRVRVQAAHFRGTEHEHLDKPEPFSLRRQSFDPRAIHAAQSVVPSHLENYRPPPGDVVRAFRGADSQRTRLSTSSRSSPLSRGLYMGSSPAPSDDDAHISTQGQEVSHARGITPFRAAIYHATAHADAKVGSSPIQLKSRKSLHQRLEEGSSGADPHPTPQHVEPQDDQRIFPRSRSGSVVSSIYARPAQEDDISSIMMAGAAEIRNAKYETEDQRREIAFLKAQFETVKAEKEEVLRRLNAVKAAAKQGLESTSKSLDDVRASLDGLKAQSQEAFAFVAQAKIALPDVQELRTIVQETVKAVEPLFNENGHIYKFEETKAALGELELECTKSHQVADLLRERLQNIGAELLEVRSRTSDLEVTQAADRDTLRVSNAALTNATAQIHELVEKLNAKQCELQSSLIFGGELEAKLAASDEQHLALKGIVEAKNRELEEMWDVQRENAKLSTLLGERDAHIASLECVQTKLDVALAASREYCTQINTLQSQLENKAENIDELRERMVLEEKKLQLQLQELQCTKQELNSVVTREEGLQKDLTRATEHNHELKAELHSVKHSLEEAKQELKACNASAQQADTKCQVLEDRIEGQLVSLRIAKETIGNLQERLTESESKFARDTEAATGKFTCQIAVLEQQKLALETKVFDLEAAVRTTQEAGSTVRAQYEDKLATQEEAYRLQLNVGQQRLDDAQKALEDARSAVKRLEEQVTASGQDAVALKKELREARLPSPAHKEALDALQAQTTALRADNTELVLRARSIDARYRTGDLNEEEKVFINTLVRTSQSIHEQELVTKGNELRRRDNTIKELHARIHLLETTLAKHLKSQAKSNPVTANENRSLIDPGAWVPSSEKSSSPVHPQAEQPEEDRPSVNVDNTVTAKPTPAPVRPTSNRALLTNNPQSTLDTPAHHKPARPILQAGAPTARSTPVAMKKTPIITPQGPDKSSPLMYPTPKVAAAGRLSTQKTMKRAMYAEKPVFSRLATDRSDEIVDYDDPSPARSPLQNLAERSATAHLKLGKRDRPSGDRSPGGGRYGKRLRTGVRTRSIAQQENFDSPTVQSPEPLAAKTRARKRR